MSAAPSGETDSLESLRRGNAARPTPIDDLPAQVSETFRQEIERANQQLKQDVANKIISFLGFSLKVTLALTLILSGIDAGFIAFELVEPTERLITENVVMAVIGATVVQVGAASIAIVYSLFGQPRVDPDE